MKNRIIFTLMIGLVSVDICSFTRRADVFNAAATQAAPTQTLTLPHKAPQPVSAPTAVARPIDVQPKKSHAAMPEGSFSDEIPMDDQTSGVTHHSPMEVGM
jgi:hypothetical protein